MLRDKTVSNYFSLKNYPIILKDTLLHPLNYASLVLNQALLADGIKIFILVISLGYSLKFILEAFFTKNLSFLFWPMVGLLFVQLFAFLSVFAIAFALYLLCQIITRQRDLKKIVKIVLFSSPPLLLFWLPLIRALCLVWVAYLLIILLYPVVKSLVRSILIVLFLSLLILLLLNMMGILQQFVFNP